MDQPFFLIILFYTLGLILIITSNSLLTKHNKIKLKGRKTKAKVINHKKEISEDTDGFKTTYYYPVIQFINEHQESKTKTLEIGTTYKRFKQNKKISITYLKTDGIYDVILNNKGHVLFYQLLFSLGILFFLIASVFLIKNFF